MRPKKWADLTAREKITGSVALLVLVVGGCAITSNFGDKGAQETKPTEQATQEPSATAPATKTPRPATPTALPPSEVPPTELPPTEPTPTAAVPTPIPPTQVPERFLSLNPDEDRDCNEFASREEAQAYWEFHRTAGRPNPGRLDGNSNGVVCEEPDRSAPAQPPAAAPATGCVNFNSAPYEDLLRIVNVEADIANQIIELRAQRAFTGWDDLVDRVKGIGKNNVKDIQAQGLGCF